jgi:membrane protease YdiL (CAAX protease family)
MNEAERDAMAKPESDGETGDTPRVPDVKPRPFLLEALLVFAAFWLSAYLPGNASAIGAALALPSYHLALVFQLLPKALLLLYLMSITDGLAAFGGVARPKAADAYRGLLDAIGAFAIVLVPAILIGQFAPAVKNPLLAAAARPSAPALLLVPSVFLSCTAVGYTEELYFRVYLIKRLGQAGLPQAWAAIAAVLLFASAHGAQGGLGIAVAALLGAWFAFRRLNGAGIHELAWGHGLYDSAIMLITLYAVQR